MPVQYFRHVRGLGTAEKVFPGDDSGALRDTACPLAGVKHDYCFWTHPAQFLRGARGRKTESSWSPVGSLGLDRLLLILDRLLWQGGAVAAETPR